MNRKLEGKIALITGSGRGIGKALALKLSSEGAKVVINDLDEVPANETVAEIKAKGGEAIAVVGSVTQEGFADRFIAEAVSAFGVPDILINNAGYTWDAMIHKASDKQFDAMYEIHLKAPFQLNRAFVQAVIPVAKSEAEAGKEVFRKIINISSIAGEYGNIGQVNYSSMKSALSGMTKTLAKELGRHKINVNGVAFGVIETRLTEATDEKKTIVIDGNEVGVGIPEKVSAGFARMIPLGRSGTAAEAADGVYLFCTPESNYISGQMTVVGGGLRM
ncbi:MULTISPECIES: SDR family NAD(P)-dependent oxidoreductase [Alteromonadaceae]|uniref:3-oxoacyl-ACP reductase n=1 Tax=Paraglaciecola chathamensis TaxID=368405 RepID=A0A8H9IK01_9ALTE|nr:SDR family NAD(P)-dependent oxidoreductase [Paraglaciecola oceanifecundans]GGZ83758.1 3-oxoacyl-ACP reductase [Paraglaciecola oceanifecundans]